MTLDRSRDREEIQAIVAWAAKRRCLRCSETALFHVLARVEGRHGLRAALVRTIDGRTHEFDPGERRRRDRG